MATCAETELLERGRKVLVVSVDGDRASVMAMPRAIPGPTED
jgi:hypothetical protein